ncbi:MAG TPA: hypothetical protein DCE44_06205 [Verrucomicrobiales bacterium]|nr:hypothetical protein [Verrucomicrobiales bacterium]
MEKNGTNRTTQKPPAFAVRAERSLKRAARNVKAQHRAFQAACDCLERRQGGGENRMTHEPVRKYAAEQGDGRKVEGICRKGHGGLLKGANCGKL